MTKKKIKYLLLPEKALCIEYYRGNILVEDIIQLKKEQAQKGVYKSSINAILLMQDVELNKLLPAALEKDLSTLINYMQNEKRVLVERKVAVVAQNPDQVAIGILFKGDALSLPMNYEIVNTIEAAIDWVGLSTDFVDELNEIIKDFRN